MLLWHGLGLDRQRQGLLGNGSDSVRFRQPYFRQRYRRDCRSFLAPRGFGSHRRQHHHGRDDGSEAN
jgi:hypothetical protein